MKASLLCASLIASLLTAGCGGGILGGRAVDYQATLTPGADTDRLTMIVTRKSSIPSANAGDCRIDQTLPDWCSSNAQTANFRVQPSYTLYRVYVRNLSGTAPATAKVSILEDGVSRGEATAEIPAGQDKWFWEIGVDTARNKAN